MQTIIDKIEAANRVGANRESVEAIVEALKLLAQAQQQCIGDIEQIERNASANYTGPIGGNP